mmetsp:Transcript_6196/g.18325  ORF Transcript_6196/g.18325 Transcript_6196/m.18325 type:complete len:366 (-) Transcript_6196:132-1229(-)
MGYPCSLIFAEAADVHILEGAACADAIDPPLPVSPLHMVVDDGNRLQARSRRLESLLQVCLAHVRVLQMHLVDAGDWMLQHAAKGGAVVLKGAIIEHDFRHLGRALDYPLRHSGTDVLVGVQLELVDGNVELQDGSDGPLRIEHAHLRVLFRSGRVGGCAAVKLDQCMDRGPVGVIEHGTIMPGTLLVVGRWALADEDVAIQLDAAPRTVRQDLDLPNDDVGVLKQQLDVLPFEVITALLEHCAKVARMDDNPDRIRGPGLAESAFLRKVAEVSPERLDQVHDVLVRVRHRRVLRLRLRHGHGCTSCGRPCMHAPCHRVSFLLETFRCRSGMNGAIIALISWDGELSRRDAYTSCWAWSCCFSIS